MCLFMPPAKLISCMYPGTPPAFKSYQRFKMNYLFGFISEMYFELNCVFDCFFTLSNGLWINSSKRLAGIICERKIVIVFLWCPRCLIKTAVLQSSFRSLFQMFIDLLKVINHFWAQSSDSDLIILFEKALLMSFWNFRVFKHRC